MLPKSKLDFFRFVLLLCSLTFHHLITNYLISKLFYNIFIYANYFFQFCSIFYLILCFLRKGYVDYKLKDTFSRSSRYCKICEGFKPTRAHHCSKCKKCIKKMDHHCMWLGVCVNYDNHGDFMRFLFFTVISLFVSLLGIINFIIKIRVNNMAKVLLAYLLLYSISLVALCSVMFKIQAQLISKNITFIEDQHYYIYDERSAYDKGFFGNWCEVMGNLYFLWLWRPNGTGLDYFRNDEIDNDDINFV
ncbi:dhhc zinc finger domain-containing protein [Vairimorpha ceranae]|uniref:Palmitoyltransferase n=1 Tax=Vairimorpha ceranae TaxID=40302 RepID=A0A0F9Z9A5_9MICR|nr:dhhc zinc finger domain-containing protein [Vairimorpha ceranae]KAF5140483.1 hypothetical protein G9O61_00g012880 [Vairimorpha ceranae]KKO74399.1 dhhc zinc finger domain-containing protein [Vairimorpha ceranae]